MVATASVMSTAAACGVGSDVAEVYEGQAVVLYLDVTEGY